MVKTDSDSGLESESVKIYRLRFRAKLPTPVDSDSDSAALLRTNVILSNRSSCDGQLFVENGKPLPKSNNSSDWVLGLV